MKSQARVVVIGGGAVGVATLYHLARKGWSDVVLVERKELTSGSTWHAAGLLPLFNMSYSVGQIHKYSVALYQTLEAETGQNVGFAKVSNIRLALSRDRMDEYHQYAGVAATIGVEVEFLTPRQVKEIWPLCNVEGLVGAIRHPEDGYIQPADLTQALARGARARGAEIYRQTRVTGIQPKPSGEWLVRTDQGDITCEHVVSATGNFARQTGAMVGLEVPVIPVEHQYIVTEPHPEIVRRHEQGLPEMGVLRESDGSWYLREEAGGLLLGPYEKGAPCCYTDGPREDAEYELFQDDLERLTPHIEAAINRVPAFGEVGVKEVYNGAICYTPDGSPIIGPAWGLRNFWLNEGHSFGITAAGGAGWQLAEWIVEGEPTIDMLGVDPRRFGDYASKAYLRRKNEEAYANVFTIHYPDEERAAGRPLRMAPCYDRMKALGAVFGQKFGWERPNWFAPEGVPQEDHWSFRRSRWFEHVGDECRNVAENVGLLDMTAFAKARVSGPGAEAFLDRLVANRIPQADRPPQPLPRAQHAGRRALRVHDPARGAGELLPGLGRRLAAARPRLAHEAHAGGRLGPVPEPHRRDGRAGGRRPQGQAALGAGERRRLLQRRLPLAHRPRDRRRPGADPGAPGQLRRRAGVGTAPRARVPEPRLRCADGGRPGPRPQALRHPRDGLACGSRSPTA